MTVLEAELRLAQRELVNRRTRRVARLPASLRRGNGGQKVEHEGHCRMCRRPAHVRPLTEHHIVPRRWWVGMDDRWRIVLHAAANVIPLCRPCHDLVEDSDVTVREPARRMCRRSMTQQEVAFAIHLQGADWVARHYPI